MLVVVVWFADVGIAVAISKAVARQPPSAGQSCQPGQEADRYFAAGQYGPCHACQLVGQRHADDVVVGSR